MADLVRFSKTLSYWLRHRPDEGGLTLDAAGWTAVDDVLSALGRAGLPSDIDAMLQVVEENDKQRFELSPDLQRMRARQGHSINVDLELAAAAPPATLYHGTVDRFLDAIMAEGLRKMRRHHVHLSPNIVTAQRVGQRRGRAIVLSVDAAAMSADGAVFFLTGNGVWLTDTVAPRYLRKV